MASMVCGFCQNVKAVRGLADYRPWHAPSWFRERLIATFSDELRDEMPDDELVRFCFGWASGCWGKAMIDGQEAFVFEGRLLNTVEDLACELRCDFDYALSDFDGVGDVIWFTPGVTVMAGSEQTVSVAT
jgi:hypothetical protein